jgi:hypothetical protein
MNQCTCGTCLVHGVNAVQQDLATRQILNHAELLQAQHNLLMFNLLNPPPVREFQGGSIDDLREFHRRMNSTQPPTMG